MPNVQRISNTLYEQMNLPGDKFETLLKHLLEHAISEASNALKLHIKFSSRAISNQVTHYEYFLLIF